MLEGKARGGKGREWERNRGDASRFFSEGRFSP